MNARQIGLKNQRKSVQYILNNSDKYGIIPNILTDKNGKITLQSPRVHNIGVGRFQEDLFGLFDIITMPERDNSSIYLVQVKSESFSLSSTKNLEYTDDILNFIVPQGVEKELHIWRKRKTSPIIIPL